MLRAHSWYLCIAPNQEIPGWDNRHPPVRGISSLSHTHCKVLAGEMLNQERQLKETSFSFSTGVALCQFEAFRLGVEDGPAKRSSVPRSLGNSLVPNQDDTLPSQGDP